MLAFARRQYHRPGYSFLPLSVSAAPIMAAAMTIAPAEARL